MTAEKEFIVLVFNAFSGVRVNYVQNVNYIIHLSRRIITDPKFVEAHLKYFLNTCWFMCTSTKKTSIDIVNRWWLETESRYSLHWRIWIITLMEMDGVFLLDPLSVY